MDTPPIIDKVYLIDHMVAHITTPRFIQEEDELHSFCGEAGFYPQTNQFALLIVRIERWSNLLAAQSKPLETTKHHFFVLNNLLSELLNQNNIAVIGEKDYQMVAIVNLKESWEDFCHALPDKLTTMMEILETEFGISVTIAVSSLSQGLYGLRNAYSEASECLWYNDFLEKEQQILFYDTLCDENQPIIHSELTELDKKLISRLQMQDIPAVKYVLHEMIDREFIEATPTVKIIRIRLGGICCKILDVLDELREFLGDPFYFQLNPGQRICEAETLSDLTAAMDDIFDTICQRLEQEKQEPKPQWVDKMSAYIEQHYTDECLGLTEVSDAFNITPSYATRVFKQYTGRGIYETIQHVRLTAAKDLLHTDMTMKQIAQMVGYTSFLSMNRAFKKYEGTTPTQFKTQ